MEASPAASSSKLPDPPQSLENPQPRTVETSDEEKALLIFEDLIRTHMNDALARVTIAAAPRNAHSISAAVHSTVLAMLAEWSPNDWGYTLLVKAAIRATTRAIGNVQTAGVADFLETLVNHTISETPDPPYKVATAVLNALLQCYTEKLVATTSFPDVVPHRSRISIVFGSRRKEVPFEEVLETLWGPGDLLNSHCHQCGRPIDEAPFRTFCGLEDGPDPAQVGIRIFNRHFSCLETSDAAFVPVSHVWHSSIRQAHSSTTHTHDAEAASTLLSTIKALTDAASPAYGPEIEFWHDYVSITQWNRRIQKELLLRLPTIYSRADEILVHLDDVPREHVHILLELGTAWTEAKTLPMHVVAAFLTPIRNFFKSRWMQRMWVTLEYAQCKGACVMDSENFIWRAVDATKPFSRKSFTTLITNGFQLIRQLCQHAVSVSFPLQKACAAIEGLTSAKTDNRQLCLGEVVELISLKDCYCFSDRFVAIQVILGLTYEKDHQPVDALGVSSCKSVWQSALRRGDYSPLLLQPRENPALPSLMSTSRDSPPPRDHLHLQPQDNLSYSVQDKDTPSWLVGHRHQRDAEWSLFWVVSPATRPIRVCDDMVQAELDFVGTIEEIHHVDMAVVPQDKSEIVVERVLRHVLPQVREEPLELVQKLLLDALGSVIPRPRAPDGTIFSSEDAAEGVGLAEALARCIEACTAVDQDESTASNELAILLGQRLGLDRPIPGRLGNLTRHVVSRGQALLRKNRGGGDGEPLCWVRCAGCSAVFLLRLDLRPSARVGDKVYRIPGLEYWGTIPDGVGLILQEGRIVGRMLHGASTCACKIPEMVEIR